MPNVKYILCVRTIYDHESQRMCIQCSIKQEGKEKPIFLSKFYLADRKGLIKAERECRKEAKKRKNKDFGELKMDNENKKKFIAHLDLSRATFHGLAAATSICLYKRSLQEGDELNIEALYERVKRENKRLTRLIEILRKEWGIEYISSGDAYREFGINLDSEVNIDEES